MELITSCTSTTDPDRLLEQVICQSNLDIRVLDKLNYFDYSAGVISEKSPSPNVRPTFKN